MFGVYRSQCGLEAAQKKFNNAKTEQEKAFWSKNVQRWRTRLKNALLQEER